MADQPGLFDKPAWFATPAGTELDPARRRYLEWRDSDAGRAVVPLFERFALQMVSRGRHFGFRLIAERVRWEIATTWEADADGFKLNDHYTPYIARELAARHPEIRSLVEFRGRLEAPQGD